MLQLKEMKEFLVNAAKNLDLNILKFSSWHSPNNNMNLDILIEKTDFSPTDLNDCSKINKLARAWLKNENLLNRTNVCIRVPGIDRELFSIDDLKRFQDSQIKIELKEKIDEKKNFQGFIKLIEYDLITLKSENEEFNIKWELVHKAFIVPDWDEVMKKARIKKIKK